MAMHKAEQLLLRWKIISRLYLELATREEEVKKWGAGGGGGGRRR